MTLSVETLEPGTCVAQQQARHDRALVDKSVSMIHMIIMLNVETSHDSDVNRTYLPQCIVIEAHVYEQHT